MDFIKNVFKYMGMVIIFILVVSLLVVASSISAHNEEKVLLGEIDNSSHKDIKDKKDILDSFFIAVEKEDKLKDIKNKIKDLDIAIKVCQATLKFLNEKYYNVPSVYAWSKKDQEEYNSSTQKLRQLEKDYNDLALKYNKVMIKNNIQFFDKEGKPLGKEVKNLNLEYNPI